MPSQQNQSQRQHRNEVLTRSQAVAGLMRLIDVQNERQAALDEINRNDLVDFEDENNDSPCPIFDTFYNVRGGEGIMLMINFSPAEFYSLWYLISEYMLSN